MIKFLNLYIMEALLRVSACEWRTGVEPAFSCRSSRSRALALQLTLLCACIISTVRRMLSASAKAEKKAAAHTVREAANNNAAGSATASPEDSSSQGHAAHSAGFCGGESGSHASTSDQAQVKAALMDCDADMETSSMDCMEALTAGMARASAADSTMHADIPGAAGPCVSGDSPHLKCGRPHALKYKASRLSMPGNANLPGAAAGSGSGAAAGTSGGSGGSGAAATTTASVGAVGGGGGGSAGSSGAPKPAMGYPAGQMPALPSNIPGIAWGLPTNPLQISPKAPAGMSGLMASMPMGWPMGPMGPMPPPAAFFSMMMGGGASPSPSVSSMSMGGCPSGPLGAALTATNGSGGAAGAAGAGASMPPPHHHGSHQHGHGMHGSASCMTLPSMGAAAAAAVVAGGGALCMKRADSAPLPAISGGCISLGSGATTMTGMGMGMGGGGGGGMPVGASMDVLSGMGMGMAANAAGLMPPPPARPPAVPSSGGAGSGPGLSKAELFAGMGGAEGERGTMPPIGLSLKKSASLVDIISQVRGECFWEGRGQLDKENSAFGLRCESCPGRAGPVR